MSVEALLVAERQLMGDLAVVRGRLREIEAMLRCEQAGITKDLSHRQRQVLELILADCQNKQIAAAMHITERGVKHHVTLLLKKFGVKRRAELRRATEEKPQ